MLGTIRHIQGASWGTEAVDPTKGYLYVVSHEHPTLQKLVLPGAGRAGKGGAGKGATSPPAAQPIAEDDSFVHYDSPMNFMYQTYNMSAMGPPWSTLTAYDLNAGTIKWQVPNGGITELEQQGHSDTGARLPVSAGTPAEVTRGAKIIARGARISAGAPRDGAPAPLDSG